MNRRNALIAGAAAMALLLLWFVLLWGPRSRAIDEARERTELAQQQQDNLRVQIARLKAAQRDEPAKRALAEGLRAAVPEEPNLGQFILDTNDAATRSGIDFLSIAPTQPTAGTTATPAPIELSMTLSGGYFQVLDFLNRLSTMPRLVVIREVNLGGRNETGRLNVSLTAQMFTSGGEGPGGAPATPPTTAPDGSTPSSTSTTVGSSG